MTNPADVNLWPGFTNPADSRNTLTTTGGGGNLYIVGLNDSAVASDSVGRVYQGVRKVVDSAPASDEATAPPPVHPYPPLRGGGRHVKPRRPRLRPPIIDDESAALILVGIL